MWLVAKSNIYLKGIFSFDLSIPTTKPTNKNKKKI